MPSLSRRLLSISLLGSTFLAPGLAHAQDAGELPVSDQQAEEPEDVISVYATLNPLPAFDYPGQVSVVEKDKILDFNPSTLADVFAAVPGAQFDQGPRRTGDAPTIRGLSGSGVLIFLDGARQSFVSGHDGRFFVDPALIETVEVVRGPTSSLYGSGALGGVIAARTVSADDLLDQGENIFVELATGYQSVNEESRASGTGAWRSADGMVDLVGHLTYRQSGDIELGSGLALPAEDEILSSLLKAAFRPSDHLELFGSWIRYGADSNDPQNPQGNNIAGPGNALVFRDAESSTLQGGLRFDPSGNELVDLNLTVYRSENSVEEDEATNPRTTDRHVETVGLSLDNRSRFALGPMAGLTLTYGAEYFEDEQSGADSASMDGRRGGVPDATTEFLGAFLQADLTAAMPGPLPGEISLVPGVRWDHFRTSEPGGAFDIDRSRLSPKAGLTYKPISQLMVFGTYAEGFRAPSFNEAFADGTHFNIPDLSAPPGPFGPSFVANLFIPNPDLRPETSRTWEGGAGIDLSDLLSRSDRLTAKASYYRSNVDDLIGLDVEIPAGCFSPALAAFAPCGTGPAFGNTSQNVNIRNAEIEGFELEFSYDAPWAYLRGNLAMIEGADADSGEFLEGVLAPDTLFLDGGLKWQAADLRLGTRLTAAEKFDRVNDPIEERDGFTVADIYAVWQPSSGPLEGVRLDLGVDNVADTNYEVVNAGVSQPGRNLKATLSWRRGF
ncbi:TonB-dependent receptor domain-containing protein [Parvularcula lutaonensis]|uniref:TonB-dependent receptor domain-containing protein n=1 Tax=Parvularcula lutaonensis TaxID=491923 RepID=A0ABV7M8F6_9PROT|nr:TonB-dependent receptor [Parvularcula lutaonensis]GGY56838.1 ligand-gated channel protein [Parvularcula lutaonensis]